MLTPINNLACIPSSEQIPQFVEKIFTDQSGRQFRLTFLVAIVDGQLKGRLVSAQPLSRGATSVFQGATLQLPISCPKNETVTEYTPAFAPIVSPYNELFFFTSQPTRAPSFAR
jgi:hypothetical protein